MDRHKMPFLYMNNDELKEHYARKVIGKFMSNCLERFKKYEQKRQLALLVNRKWRCHVQKYKFY